MGYNNKKQHKHPIQVIQNRVVRNTFKYPLRPRLNDSIIYVHIQTKQIFKPFNKNNLESAMQPYPSN